MKKLDFDNLMRLDFKVFIKEALRLKVCGTWNADQYKAMVNQWIVPNPKDKRDQGRLL